MARDPMTRRRSRKLVFALLAVGIIASALVTIALYYLGQALPGFQAKH